MAIAVAIALLVLVSIAFHWLSPWWHTPIASNWGSIDSALDVTLWICAAAFIALNLFLAWTLLRYRHRAGHRAHYEPENTTLEKRLTFWTGVGIAGMLAPGLLAWNQYVTVPKDAAIVEAIGQQWQWGFRFPGADGVLGTTNISHVTPENSFGVNPSDPYGQDDILVESPELHLPVGKPVKLILRSKDVLHDFYVPNFRAKMDLVPGIVTYIWLTPTRTGTYEIMCAELCGVGHHMMRGTVIISNERNFRSWLGQQQTYAQLAAAAAAPAPTQLSQAEIAAQQPKGER